MAEQKETARAQVRRWTREQLEGRDEVELPDLRDAALAFFKADKKFITTYVAETLPDMLYETIRYEVGRAGRLAIVGDAAVTPEALNTRASSFANRFLNWFEQRAEGHVRIMDATREDLLEAAAIRRQRGNHELNIAALWEGIASHLEGGQRVSERFTADEVAAMYQRIEARQQEGAA